MLRVGPALVAGVFVAATAAAPRVAADPLPSGSIGVMFGGGGGTGQYARKLGLGYYQFGGQAAWQPMTTDQRIGWSAKWQFVFGTMYGAESARINVNLLTLQMDFMAGLRIRPGENRTRYLALRGGLELFRANEGIQPDGGGDRQRAFVGPVAEAAFEQYAFGSFLFNVDVRYGLIGSGPAEIALLVGAAISVF
jgi:hypothetical protein